MVEDIEAELSEAAVATVLFTNVDNPPVLDLNGPLQPGRNHSTTFTEGSPAISVRR